jgi:hypothetical protein
MGRRFGRPRIEISAADDRRVTAAPLPKMLALDCDAHRGHGLRYIVTAKYLLCLIK